MKFNFKKKGPCYRWPIHLNDLENNCQSKKIFYQWQDQDTLFANEVLKCIRNHKNT